jgi:hypothetical protein
MPPFTRRPEPGRAGGAQQLVRCYVDVAGDYDGEPHDAGEWVYLDELQAHALQRQRKVRIATAAEAEAVSRADQALRPALWPRMHLSMDLQ